MASVIKPLSWLLKAAIFFALFAFALNNQQDVVLHFFFGRVWQAPLVLVVLAVFSAGVAVGVVGMLPVWWRQRRATQLAGQMATPATSTNPPPVMPTPDVTPAAPSGDKPLRELGI